MTESVVATNNVGSGQVATVDPKLSIISRKKPLRQILGTKKKV